MIDKVWIVYGAQGCYSDASEWTVCACMTEEKASEITNELRLRLDLFNKAHGGSRGYWDDEKQEYIYYPEHDYICEIDRDFYAGDEPSYHYYECEVR